MLKNLRIGITIFGYALGWATLAMLISRLLIIHIVKPIFEWFNNGEMWHSISTLSITGIGWLDLLIVIILGFFLVLARLAWDAIKDHFKIQGYINEGILFVIFIPFCLFGTIITYLNFLIGDYAVYLITIPCVTFLCFFNSILDYYDFISQLHSGSIAGFLSEGIKFFSDPIYTSKFISWYIQDGISIGNFFDYWIYSQRVQSLGYRFEGFWPWIGFVINLLCSVAFLVVGCRVSIHYSVEQLNRYKTEAKKQRLSIKKTTGKPLFTFLALLLVIWLAFIGLNWATEGSKFALANSKNSLKADPAVISPNSINTSLASTTTLSMDGSVTMVKMMKFLREEYKQINPKVQITYGFDINGKPAQGQNVRPTGSSGGLKNLIKGTVTMAASSRPLKPDEAKAGIKLVPIARDAIALVVGINNPFKGGLTTEQLRQIYQGQITNWSQVGGANKPIKVYNRGTESGTKDFFKDHILLGSSFAPNSNNFKTWERDETTAVLRVLADNGIYYSTVSQAQGQEIIRVVPIDGINPLNKETIKKKLYPISRDLYLAIPAKTSPEVKQFIEFARSPKGQQLIEKAEFISIL